MWPLSEGDGSGSSRFGGLPDKGGLLPGERRDSCLRQEGWLLKVMLVTSKPKGHGL